MRASLVKRRSQKRGLPPGSLIHIGERRRERARISIINYSEDRFEEKKDISVAEALARKDAPGVTWIDLEGLHDVPVLGALGEGLVLHPLVMEDILNTDQRPKMEDYGEYLYIVLKMLCFDEKHGIVADQVSIILGKNLVVSFQEGELDVFEPLRQRLREGKGRARKMGADYLAYSLVDAIVDNYFAILERIGDEIEILEDELVQAPKPAVAHKIHRIKRDMLFLRHLIWPIRELVGALERGESQLITPPISMYLRDVYDHAVYLVDTIETFRDMLAGILDLYLSSINNRLNEVMKVLTIIATLFMPLTFIAGVYGMNFRNMPEIEWKFGYPAVLAGMAGVAGAMFVYFRKKRWL